jgi:hypothetical protein
VPDLDVHARSTEQDLASSVPRKGVAIAIDHAPRVSRPASRLR